MGLWNNSWVKNVSEHLLGPRRKTPGSCIPFEGSPRLSRQGLNLTPILAALSTNPVTSTRKTGNQ